MSGLKDDGSGMVNLTDLIDEIISRAFKGGDGALAKLSSCYYAGLRELGMEPGEQIPFDDLWQMARGDAEALQVMTTVVYAGGVAVVEEFMRRKNAEGNEPDN